LNNKPGRKAIDGVHGATERVNIVLTKEHRDRLKQLAPNGFSPWVRAAIDKAWNEKESNK
jgi:hypothetical protein